MQTIQEALEQVWSDEALKNRLLSDPKPVLSEFGLDISDQVDVKVHENTANCLNFILPEQAIFEGADPEALDPVAGKVMKRAWADSEFKTQLLAAPKAAIQDATGVTLPEEMTVNVYENTPEVRHMILPANPNDSELSDMDLEGVAGGLSKGAQWGVGCGSAGAVTGVAAGGFGIAAAALAFSAVGTAVTGIIAGGLGVAGGVASGISTAGGTVASSKGKC
ncbi:NHLP leader peptide family natural product precursor [Cyanobacteria bacterium FACHB-DQ100]|nr:NHLP leader peptide family natural product precursor [Cyanobacteria bacterium FACHB-DQ100]